MEMIPDCKVHQIYINKTSMSTWESLLSGYVVIHMVCLCSSCPFRAKCKLWSRLQQYWICQLAGRQSPAYQLPGCGNLAGVEVKPSGTFTEFPTESCIGLYEENSLCLMFSVKLTHWSVVMQTCQTIYWSSQVVTWHLLLCKRPTEIYQWLCILFRHLSSVLCKCQWVYIPWKYTVWVVEKIKKWW